MKMMIAHVGRTGKDSTIIFDTEAKTYTRGHVHGGDHDVYIYAERTADVNYVIHDLKNLGYKEMIV